MKTLQEVSEDKVRGGFYTPGPLVRVCLDLVARLSGERTGLRLLEPSAGDGAFLRYLINHKLSSQVADVFGLEIMAKEAEKARQAASAGQFKTEIQTGSALKWAAESNEWFDLAVGNPPFVRYQFVSSEELSAIERLGKRMGLAFRGVANLWIPVLLGALSRLRPGGAMAFVVPAEIFTGLSAGDARTWLTSNFANLRIDLFEPGSFPDVLQEIVIISGRRSVATDENGSGYRQVRFVEHWSTLAEKEWGHNVPKGPINWTQYLLAPEHLEALNLARTLPCVQSFSNIAKLDVSTVTGANDFFSVTKAELEKYQLEEWADPLLPRIRHARELVYSTADHEVTAENGAKAWLLNFSEGRPDPLGFDGPAEYLRLGETLGLDKRYKTSIRTPWYRVPIVPPGKLMLTKRSHRYPRLVLNYAGVLTTDTIYRGNMKRPYIGGERALVASFHNSITMLTAELEGRSFGGGVLELVPSEIARLAVPFPLDLEDELPRLCAIASTSSPADGEGLITATDELLLKRIPDLNPEVMSRIQEARSILLGRRLSRN